MSAGRSLVAATFIALCAAACSPQDSWTVSEEGFGPVRFGMKVEEAEKLLGVKLQQDNYNDSDECRYFTPIGVLAGLLFMTSNRSIVRVDVQATEGNATLPAIATDVGAKIGDAEAHVIGLYKGHVKVGPHFYTGPEGHYLRVNNRRGKVRLIFETDGAKVVSFRAGREPQIEYVEGCQ